MDNVKTELKKLDLSEKEITIYLTLLSLGSASVRTISAMAKINRGTTYNILRSLSDQNLASLLEEGGTKRFVAQDPNNLHVLLNSQQDGLNALRKDLNNIVHQLGSIYHTHGNKPLARFYEGIEGAELILRDVLATMAEVEPKEYYVYSHPSIRNNLYDKFQDYNRTRIASGIAVKSISFDKGGSLSGLDQRTWLETEGDQLTYILIYHGKVAFIARDHGGNLSGVLIENNHVYLTQKTIFLTLWSILPDINNQ